jgi:hypothetical protein
LWLESIQKLSPSELGLASTAIGLGEILGEVIVISVGNRVSIWKSVVVTFVLAIVVGFGAHPCCLLWPSLRRSLSLVCRRVLQESWRRGPQRSSRASSACSRSTSCTRLVTLRMQLRCALHDAETLVW